MIYTDADRLAHYEGDVVLNRPGLNVKTADMRAFLNPRDTDEDSRLNHAVGEGQVEITETSPVRQRIGRGEHGEYFTADDKIVLRGNLADLYDSIKKDDSHGTELTYFTTDDRLIVAGAPRKPVTSHLQRKNHAKPNANPGNR
jgi:lipopolysaccharide export system protein LptA